MAPQPVPSYRLHKPSGQARTTIHGRDTSTSKNAACQREQEKHAQSLAELSQPNNSADVDGAATRLMLVSGLLGKYLEDAED